MRFKIDGTFVAVSQMGEEERENAGKMQVGDVLLFSGGGPFEVRMECLPDEESEVMRKVDVTHRCKGCEANLISTDGEYCSDACRYGWIGAGSEKGEAIVDRERRAPIPDFVRALPSHCSPTCKGWFVAERSDDGTLEVERCHECDAFEFDEDAVPFARAAGIQVTFETPFRVLGLDMDALSVNYVRAACGDCDDTGVTELNGSRCYCAAGKTKEKMSANKRTYLATVTLLIEAEDSGTACDTLSEMFRNPDNSIKDWGYVSIGGRRLSPIPVAIEKDYEEGDLFQVVQDDPGGEVPGREIKEG
jgi:hypothetical protein